jgi:hypothetical protein
VLPVAPAFVKEYVVAAYAGIGESVEIRTARIKPVLRSGFMPPV